MGFKLIRETATLDQAKQDQLLTELTRWRNLTRRTDESAVSIPRCPSVEEGQLEKSVESLSKNITRESASIVKIQGNLEIERLQEILEDLGKV